MKDEKTYSEKLKDPRWQKKRLEILERDKFRCVVCMNDTKMLHVHHMVYVKGKNPWDAQNNDLVTLCEECHKTYHSIYDNNSPEYVSAIVEMHDKWESWDINYNHSIGHVGKHYYEPNCQCKRCDDTRKKTYSEGLTIHDMVFNPF